MFTPLLLAFAAATNPTLQLQPCDLRDVGSALCGTFGVPENRRAPKSKTISLKVVILPAAKQPTKHAFLFLDGGPGQAAAGKADGFISPAMQKIRQTHDIVLVDQRGTGQSNSLGCLDDAKALGPQSFVDDLFADAIIRRCASHLAGDSRFYTTHDFIADLEALRIARGYEQLDLYGLSYGTRVAQAYAQAHPAHVRTIVLEGVLGPDWVLPLPFAPGVRQSLDRTLDDCAADPACSSAFPDSRADFTRVVATIDHSPPSVVAKAESGTVAFKLTRGLLANTIRGLLYDTGGQSKLPLLIHQAASGDYSGLAQRAFDSRPGFYDGIGLYLSVVCAEDMSRATAIAARQMAVGTLLGTYWYDRLAAACRLWPTPLPQARPPLKKLEIPTLVITGALDPTTPPPSAFDAAQWFENSRVVYLPQHGHVFWDNFDCIDAMVSGMVLSGDPHKVDTSCARGIKRPPFVLK
jgi:pimeloyl-ACP methyl ester carboxylesterase